MKAKKIILTIDTVIQGVILIPAILAGLISLITTETVFIYILGILTLGCWQLMSGFLLGVGLRDDIRLGYFFISVIYLFCLYLGVIFFSGFHFSYISNLLLITLFLGIIPLGIGIWYFQYSNRRLKETNAKTEKNNRNALELKNILDSDEVLNNY